VAKTKVLFVAGTRPETLKLYPVHIAAKAGGMTSRFCCTGQNRDIVDSVFATFGFNPDYDLEIGATTLEPAAIFAKVMSSLAKVITEYQPNLIVVQGDTVSSTATALTAFYSKVPVVHIEAGLRTGDPKAPWPEEMNRRVTSQIAALHFAPTEAAKANLVKENVPPARVHIVGNTVVDTLRLALDRLSASPEVREGFDARFDFLDPRKKLVLTTQHRAESFGKNLENIGRALFSLLRAHKDVEIVFPMHTDPAVRDAFKQAAVAADESTKSRMHMIDPVDYLPFVYLMQRSRFIISDSGTIQEEAPYLGKPVLVTRDKTERPEGIDAGVARLVGTDARRIEREAGDLLVGDSWMKNSREKSKIYGDGHTAPEIVTILGAYTTSL